MNEGEVSGRLGLAGWPAVAEEAIIARDCLLAAHVGSALHVCHVSTAGSVEIIRWAKSKGWRVTAEVTPHHLLLTDDLARATTRCTRSTRRCAPRPTSPALREAWPTGPSTAWPPTTRRTRPRTRTRVGRRGHGHDRPGDRAAVVQQAMVDTGLLDWAGVADRMSVRPAAIGRLAGHGRPLAVGGARPTSCSTTRRPPAGRPAAPRLRSRNTPFAGMDLPGRVVATFLRGRPDRPGRQAGRGERRVRRDSPRGSLTAAAPPAAAGPGGRHHASAAPASAPRARPSARWSSTPA